MAVDPVGGLGGRNMGVLVYHVVCFPQPPAGDTGLGLTERAPGAGRGRIASRGRTADRLGHGRIASPRRRCMRNAMLLS